MSTPPPLSWLERAVRQQVYRHFVERGRAPSAVEVAAALGRAPAEVEAAYRSLAEAHVLVLQPGTVDVRMAMPFSAVETTFPVVTPRGSWWANCVWDALAIPAMLGCDARVDSRCGCCDDSLPLEVKGGRLEGTQGVIHFAVPASRWWEDICFT